MSAFEDLAGKRVVVTGASQGIGMGLAQAFHREGCHVVAIARGPIDWANGWAGDRLETVRADVRDLSTLRAWLADATRDGTGIDVLVNNAGHLSASPLLECSPEEFDEMFGVNTRATFFLSQLFAEHMRTRGGGVILNIASYAATLASIPYGVYAASKAAIVSLTRSMAAEWAPLGIRVNALSPGVIPTRMTEPALSRHEARMLESISLHRVGTVNEVADTALFLASDRSSYLTGVNLDVSGGKLLVQNPNAAWS